ncbi:hypothetical protein BRD00_01610 [Halobacteriales archaeon QS_8_69_26]|nr:MAG: hypothetical protein BRD00_01610 [Halobacteriales archaeon QS_8_69_26]
MTNSSRYGKLAEQEAASRYGFDVVHNEWRDGCHQNGTPVQVKAAQEKRLSGSEGRFRLWEADHRRLRARDGWYVFVAYRPHGNGIRVINMVRKRPSDVPVGGFYGSGRHPHGNRQAKVAVSDIF